MENTTVLDLETLAEYNYSLPPEKAVIAAQRQFGKRDWNTWGYDFTKELKYLRWTVCCGDRFSAIYKQPTIQEIKDAQI